MDLESMPVTLTLILLSLGANGLTIDVAIPQACMCPPQT